MYKPILVDQDFEQAMTSQPSSTSSNESTSGGVEETTSGISGQGLSTESITGNAISSDDVMTSSQDPALSPHLMDLQQVVVLKKPHVEYQVRVYRLNRGQESPYLTHSSYLIRKQLYYQNYLLQPIP